TRPTLAVREHKKGRVFFGMEGTYGLKVMAGFVQGDVLGDQVNDIYFLLNFFDYTHCASLFLEVKINNLYTIITKGSARWFRRAYMLNQEELWLDAVCCG
ncbi:MAG: hypothetical protein U1D67_06965, partial [Dehalococcoidia bacterium]|nr:hypothetical protein [Dehalococcoidia bacterium]